MNLAEWPIGFLSKRAPGDASEVRFQDQVRLRGGRQVERQWLVSAPKSIGLPTAPDEALYVALMELSYEEGFRSPLVRFRRSDLLRRLGWPADGPHYQRLVAALDRLTGVVVRSKGAFWDQRQGEYVAGEMAGGILDEYELRREKSGPQQPDRDPDSFIRWGERLFDSFRSGYVKQLDLGVYFALSSPVARRLFRFLDKQRYRDARRRKAGGARQLSFDLRVLALEKLGLSRSYRDLAQLKRQLDPAHDELVASGYLRSARYQAKRRGQASVTYHFGRAAKLKPLPLPAATQPSPPADTLSLVADLISLGVAEAAARELAETYHERRILLWVEYVKKRLADGWLPRESPAAYLVAMMRDESARVPEWFAEELDAAALSVAEEAQRREQWDQQRRQEADEDRKTRERIEAELGIGPRTRELWEQAKALLDKRGALYPSLLMSYLLPLRRGSVATVVAPAAIIVPSIEERADEVAEALGELLGRPVKVTVQAREALRHPEQPALFDGGDEGNEGEGG